MSHGRIPAHAPATNDGSDWWPTFCLASCRPYFLSCSLPIQEWQGFLEEGGPWHQFHVPGSGCGARRGCGLREYVRSHIQSKTSGRRHYVDPFSDLAQVPRKPKQALELWPAVLNLTLQIFSRPEGLRISRTACQLSVRQRNTLTSFPCSILLRIWASQLIRAIGSSQRRSQDNFQVPTHPMPTPPCGRMRSDEIPDVLLPLAGQWELLVDACFISAHYSETWTSFLHLAPTRGNIFRVTDCRVLVGRLASSCGMRSSSWTGLHVKNSHVCLSDLERI